MSKQKKPATTPEWQRPAELDAETKDRITFLYDPRSREKLREFAKVYKTSEAGVIRAALAYYMEAAPDEADPRDFQEASDEV